MVDTPSGHLELRRIEECYPRRLALLVYALRHRLSRRSSGRVVALLDVVGPERQTRSVRLAMQEVVIMRTHKVTRIIYRIHSRLRRIVQDAQDGRLRYSKHCASRGIRQRQLQRLRSFHVVILADQHVEGLRGFARRKPQSAYRRGKVTARR